MRKFSVLVVGFLLMVSSAFAVEPVQPVQPHITVTVAGKIVATLSMADQPEGAVFTVDAPSGMIHDAAKGTTTTTGKCTIEVRKGDKRLLQIVVEDGVVKIYSKAEPTPR